MAGEFKGDFTRDTFYSHRHYCSVFQQQGRVSLDADGNEQASILLNMLRSVCKDAIADGDVGPNKQFTLVPLTLPAGTSNDRDFGIIPGHIFVDGIQCILNGSKIPFSLGATGNGKIQVSQWLVDGVPYQQGQYVMAVVVDPTKTADTLITQSAVISLAEAASRTLTINPALTQPSGSPQNGNRLIRLPSFLHQPDYVPTAEEVSALKNLAQNQNSFLVYLEAWERHVSYIQSPWIREIALGGPDTCVRSQLLTQVKIAWDFQSPLPDLRKATPNDVQTLKSALEDQYQPYNRGWLRARLKSVDPGTPDPCMCHPDARYRGAENQLYRVEIHLPGQAPTYNAVTMREVNTAPASSTSNATFKWSRNNASDVYPVISITGAEVLVESIGRDVRSNLQSKDWVELLDDILIKQGKPGQLLQVSEVSAQDRRATLVAAPSYQVKPKDSDHPHAFLRRWDHSDPATNGLGSGIPITEAANPQSDPWFDLEDGIQIQFVTALSPQVPDEPGSDSYEAPVNIYRTGDYWLIPARTALQGSIEWPATTDNPPVPIALPPHGIDHHYFPLGVVTLANASSNQLGVTPQFTTPIKPIT